MYIAGSVGDSSSVGGALAVLVGEARSAGRPREARSEGVLRSYNRYSSGAAQSPPLSRSTLRCFEKATFACSATGNVNKTRLLLRLTVRYSRLKAKRQIAFYGIRNGVVWLHCVDIVKIARQARYLLQQHISPHLVTLPPLHMNKNTCTHHVKPGAFVHNCHLEHLDIT